MNFFHVIAIIVTGVGVWALVNALTTPRTPYRPPVAHSRIPHQAQVPQPPSPFPPSRIVFNHPAQQLTAIQTPNPARPPVTANQRPRPGTNRQIQFHDGPSRQGPICFVTGQPSATCTCGRH